MAEPSTAVVLLAGGEATRWPGKLERPLDGTPMVVHVFRRLRASGWPVYVAGKGSFPPTIDAALECPLLIDRTPRAGPLAALYSACGEIPQRRVFAVAADQPMLGASLCERLSQAWQSEDEAVVPEHGGQMEPLAALYARDAVLRESFALLRDGNAAMRDFIERIRARFVGVPSSYFVNANRPEDLARS